MKTRNIKLRHKRVKQALQTKTKGLCKITYKKPVWNGYFALNLI